MTPASTSPTDDAPSLNLQLDHASIMTTDLEAATDFYVDMLGLTLRTVEDDPVREGRRIST
jgi:glyoxylase I family protein